MKILLTGANGQLGRALQMALKHHHVVALAHDPIDIPSLIRCWPRCNIIGLAWRSMQRPSTMLMGQRAGVMKPFGSMLWGHEI